MKLYYKWKHKKRELSGQTEKTEYLVQKQKWQDRERAYYGGIWFLCLAAYQKYYCSLYTTKKESISLHWDLSLDSLTES